MSPGEEQSIIAAMHAMEVRFTERLARIEAEASAWRKTHDDLRDDIERVWSDAKEAAKAVAIKQAADQEAMLARIERYSDECRISAQRLTIGLVVVYIIAVGRIGVSVFEYLT